MERRIRKDRHPLFKLRAEHSMSLFYCPMLGQGEKIMGKFIDLTGKKFGKWTVLRYVEKNKWLCKCECGVEKEVAGATLRHGTSSGCIKCRKIAKDFTGMVIGDLTI